MGLSTERTVPTPQPLGRLNRTNETMRTIGGFILSTATSSARRISLSLDLPLWVHRPFGPNYIFIGRREGACR